MDSPVALKLIDGFLLLLLFVGAPCLAAAIGYLAWKGKPKNFDRQMWFTAFGSAVGVSGFFMWYAFRMHADVRTWQYLVQLVCFILGAALFGIAMGCGIGIFTYRGKSLSQKPPETT